MRQVIASRIYSVWAFFFFWLLCAFPVQASSYDTVLSHINEQVKSLTFFIYEHPTETDMGRFFVLDGGVQKYVQCHFFERDKVLFCESSSGRYGPAGALSLSASAKAEIAKEGFGATEGTENYAKQWPVESKQSLLPIIHHVVRLFYHVYFDGKDDVTLCSPYFDFFFEKNSCHRLLRQYQNRDRMIDILRSGRDVPDFFVSIREGPHFETEKVFRLPLISEPEVYATNSLFVFDGYDGHGRKARFVYKGKEGLFVQENWNLSAPDSLE